MVSMEDLVDIVRYAEARGAKVVLTGDHGQLTAVESGGGMQLLTRQMEYAQLAEPVRFRAEWEGEASLRLRTGDAAVLTEYDRHGRIRGGDSDTIMDEARKAYLAAYLEGRDVLLMAQSHDTCREISQRIQDDLRHLGLVDDGPSAALRDGARASVGDLIITRKNNHDLGIANGDTWRVEAVDGETITMRQLVDADRETGERRFADTTVTYDAGSTSADLAYAVDEHKGTDRAADLAYAITGHSAQGRTVSQGIALITGTETREWAYVAMSRGADANYAFVATEPARIADPKPGIRAAPELARHDRIERERAGIVDDPPARSHGDMDREPIGVLSDVLANEGAELSALELQRRNLANADHLGKLHAVWQNETGRRDHRPVRAPAAGTLPEDWKGVDLSGHATWLWRTLRGAEAAGQDAGDVLARAISSKPLTGARDVAAVIDARIREHTGTLVPQDPGPWADRVPDIEDAGRREYVGQLAEAMDGRTDGSASSPPRRRQCGRPARSARCPPTSWTGSNGRTGPPRSPPTGRCSVTTTPATRSAPSRSTPRRPAPPGLRRSPPWARSTASTSPRSVTSACSTCGRAMRPRPHGRRGTWATSSGWPGSAPTAWAGAPLSPPPRLRLPAAAAPRTPQTFTTFTPDPPASMRPGTGTRRPSSPPRWRRGLRGNSTPSGPAPGPAANSEYLRRHPDAELPPTRSAEPPAGPKKNAPRS